MKKLYFLFLSLLCFQFALAQPANDDCSNAQVINVTTSNINIPFDINTATLNNEEGCSGTTADYADVWYEFTMPVNGNLYIDGAIGWNNFAIYDACGGTELNCFATNALLDNLTSGSTYKLRVFRSASTYTNTGYQNFSIQAFQSATNDDCSNAQNISVSTSASTLNFEIAGATINNEIGCSGTTDDYLDIWYDFTMPVNGNLYVNGVIGWNNFALYDACSGTQIQCGSANQLIEGLTSGTTYKLRVFRTVTLATNSGYKSFTIQAFENPTNDDCSSSENISVSTTIATVNFEITGASINNEIGCTGTTDNYLDIWYDFTMPVNGNLYLGGAINWNNFALYDACNGTQIHCGSANQLIEGLTSGTTYKLRVFRTVGLAANSGYQDFTIQAFESPTNDDCSSSENISVTTTIATVNFEITGASINNEIGCTGTTDNYLDLWYDFTMPVNGNLYVNGVIGWNNFALYDACNGTEIQCDSANQLIEGLTFGTTYKLRVFRTVALAANSGYQAFTIQAFEIINNDNCADAETISISSTPTTVNFGIAGASINNEEGCSGTIDDYADVWYEFTMPEDGSVSVDGTIGWNNFALYDTCGGTQLDCFNASGAFTGLTNGTNYKLRVFRTQANATNTGYKSFVIQTTSTLNTQEFVFEDAVKLYPNPVSSVLNIQTEKNISTISISDINGRMVIQQAFSSSIDISKLSKGMYFISLKTPETTITKKIIVK